MSSMFWEDIHSIMEEDDLIYEILFAYISEEPYNLTVLQHDCCAFLYKAVKDQMRRAKGGVLTYMTSLNGDEIRIESTSGSTKSSSRKASAKKKPAAGRTATRKPATKHRTTGARR